MAEELSIVGKRLPRHDAIPKVDGSIKYITDIKLPRMLEARFLRSPYAHARIKDIDTSRAEQLPGVRAILTHQDVPKAHPWNKFEYLLDPEIHYPGEEVVAVAADTTEIAEAALQLIKVDYEVLPAVFDILEAMQPGAPLVHPEYGTNMFHGSASQPVPRAKPDGWLNIPFGDVEKGFAEADAIVESDYATPNQQMVSPLPRAVVCEWVGDKLNVYADTQMPMGLHLDMANCLRMPQSSIRIICAPTVGCYGGKAPEKIATLCALLSKKARLPVRTVFSRAEDMIATRIRPNYIAHEKIGVKKDGTITAMQSRFITNFGRDSIAAFQDPVCAALNSGTLLWMSQTSRADVCTVMTNIVDCMGMNAYGDTEGTYIIDRLIDEAAEKIDMDPVEFALKNCTRYGAKAQRYLTVMGTTEEAGAGQASAESDIKQEVGAIEWGIMGPDAEAFPECIRRVAEKAEWQKKWRGWRTPMAVNGAKRRGIGIAIGMHHTLYTKYAGTVKMNQDGTANVLSSGIEIGQGYGTALAQVVAETLGIRYEDVYIVNPDSAMSPAGVGNFASCGVTSGVGSVWRAALDARRQLFNLAAEQLKVKPEELEAKNRRVQVKSRPEINVPIAKLCMDAYQIIGHAVNPPVETLRDEKTGKVIYPFAYAASITEVEVDTETGQVEVLRVTSAHDLGRAINPTIVENQIDMSLTLGNGYCRTEFLAWDKKTGVLLNPNLLDYKIMTFLDMPRMKDMHEIYVEFPTPWGAFGAKGFSETGTTTPGPCIANAIYNAIGVRVRSDHLMPENILEAMGKLKPRRL